jgi:toxin FitB
MILVDTNVISELWRDRPNSRVVEWLEYQPRESIFVSSITLAELYFGIVRLDDGRNKLRMSKSIARIERETFAGRVLSFDNKTAVQFGIVRAAWERMGRPINFPDSAIAATALTYGLTLATRNIRDFEGLDLELINPFEPQP